MLLIDLSLKSYSDYTSLIYLLQKNFIIFSNYLGITVNVSRVQASTQLLEYRGVFRTLSNV